MKVKSESEVAQSCPTLSDPINCSLPGSSTHEIFQVRVLVHRVNNLFLGSAGVPMLVSQLQRVLVDVPSCLAAAVAAKSFQSCLTLCDPRDGSPPGSPVPGILQARTLEWVAMSFSNA